ncbi:hypothetical protein AGMMS49574_29170 [Bacteroidia bacterium]|nr:hypothetical protein AGMMS49574_29170 [Bacteroidia bacterium]
MLKVNKDGIEISHSRYLSDNSTGLIVILNLIILSHFDSFKFINDFFENKSAIEVFAIFLLFLLATSLGLIVSFLSYFFLELIYICLEWIWWKFNFPLFPIQFKQKFYYLVETHDIKYKNWHSKLVVFEDELLNIKVDINRFLIQRGTRILLRNISFILLVNYILFLTIEGSNQYILLISSILFLVFSSYVGFFSNVGLLLKYDLNSRSTIAL